MEHQRKKQWGNASGVVFLDDATSFFGAFFCQVKVTLLTKENKELVEKVAVAAAVITVTIYQLSCDNLICFFPLVRMLALRDPVLEVYLYQKEANIICHSPSCVGCSLTAKSPWKANRSSRITAASPVKAPVLSCLLTESQLGLAWVQWGCGDLSQLLPQPASLEYAL